MNTSDADDTPASDVVGDYGLLSRAEGTESDEVRNDDGDEVVDPPDADDDVVDDEPILGSDVALDEPGEFHGQIDGTIEDGESLFTIVDD